jgi:tetratricopeptide (TPR) repeat protein
MAAKLSLPEEAQTYFEQVLNDPSGEATPWHPKAFWGFLHLLYEQQRYADLIDQYQSRRISFSGVAATNEARIPILIMVAHSFRRLEKYRQAASLYDHVYRLDPEGPEARESGYRHLYCLYKDQSPFLAAKIEDYLEQQQEEGSTDHQYYHLTLLLKAESLFSQRRKTSKVYALAADTYGDIRLNLIPEEYHALVLYKMGWAYCEAGNHTQGIRAFYQFLDSHSESHPELVGKVLAKRGEAQRKQGNYKDAKEDFQQLITLNQDKQLVYLAMQQSALIDVERKDHESTIVSFQALLDRFPDGMGSSEARFFIGDAHYQLGNYEDAIPSLINARELDSEAYTIPATQRVIISHWRQDNLEAAADEVDLLLNADPKTNLIPPKLWLWLGTRSFQKDQFVKAARYLRQVATPTSPKDTWPLAWSFLGQAHLHSGSYEESIAPFDHYLASNPARSERAKTLLHKATALSKLDRLDEAQTAAEEVQLLQKQGRTYGLSWILLGDISMAKEDYEKASKYYVIPSRMFKDPLVTPVALEKAAEAFDRMGENERGSDLRRQLQKEWPRHQTASTNL